MVGKVFPHITEEELLRNPKVPQGGGQRPTTFDSSGDPLSHPCTQGRDLFNQKPLLFIRNGFYYFFIPQEHLPAFQLDLQDLQPAVLPELVPVLLPAVSLSQVLSEFPPEAFLLPEVLMSLTA